MKNKPLNEDHSDKSEDQNKSSVEHIEPEKKTWCSYMENGFRESRVEKIIKPVI